MSVTITIDTRGFNAALQGLIASSQKEPHVILRQQMRLLVERLVMLTPPPYGRKTKKAAKEAGENKIMGDLLGRSSFRGAAAAGIFQGEGNPGVVTANTVRLFVANGYAYGVDRNLYRPNASNAEMETHHRTYFKNGRMSQAGGRTRDIGRWRFIDKMVVNKGKLGRFIKRLQKHVGRAKGGWNAAAQKFSYNAPPWVSRHGTGDGSATETMNARGGTLVAINRNKAIGSLENQARIVQNAYIGRERDMKVAFQGWLDRRARKFSR